MTELQQMLADSSAELFAAEVAPELLATSESGAWPEELWRILDDAGYPQLFSEPELGWADAYPLVEAAGNALLPVPLPEMLLATWLLRQAGIDPPAGIIVPAAAQRAVPFARFADHVVTVENERGAPAVVVWAIEAAHVVCRENAAGEPRDDVEFGGAVRIASAPLGTLPADILRRFGALLRATQIAGALRRVLALTAHYARERTQFGRPIGQFQAISQQLAVLAEESTAATIAAAYGWERAAADPASGAVAVAKVRAGMAAARGAAIAHAVFGAIGITAEHSLHFATRRLWSWRAEFGAEREWAAILGDTAIRAGGERLWPSVVGM
jgi:acyl-CoA dehydrogenase